MMTDQQFDKRIAEIDQEHARRREGADAWRDQEMARLFEECGWTQERIAERMGKSQKWVSNRLLFGRFLAFRTSGSNDALTERRFREHWKCTKGREEERFEQVAYRLEHGIPHGIEAIINKPAIQKAVTDCLADGKAYTVEQITATVEESLPGITTEQVRSAVTKLRSHPPAGKELQSKLIGHHKAQYRLAKARPDAKEKDAYAAHIYEQAQPILDELDELGRMSRARLSAGLVKQVAFKLRRLFESMLKETTA